MADADSRLETVEDELKVLKGEVRRTLVDLRALLMRADSPMNEGNIGRRDALPDRDPEDEPKPARTEMTQVIQQETATVPAAAPPAVPAPEPAQPAAAGPGQPPAGGPGQPPGGLFPPGAGPQQGTILGPVAAAPIAVTNGDQEQAMAEQQRRMADQERRIADQNNQVAELSRMVQEGAQAAQPPLGPDAGQQHKLEEQERQIADQSRQMAEMGRRMDDESRNARDSRDSDGQQERRLEDQARSIADQNRRMSALDRKLEEQAESAESGGNGNDEDRAHREAEQNRQIAELKRKVEEEGRSTRDALAEARKTSQPPPRREPEVPEDLTGLDAPEPDFEDDLQEPYIPDQDEAFRDGGFDQYQEKIEEPRRSAGRREENVSRQRDHRADGRRGAEGPRDDSRRPSRPAKTRSSDMVGNRRRDSVHDDVENRYRSESGSHVYDEYHQLFEAVGDAEGVEESAGNTAPLDMNLLASLVRWMTLAKGRVGQARLKTILDVYLGSGRSSPQLRELLISVSGMVDTVSPETPQAAQECMDLLSHLHGILTGGLQIAQVPQISLSE